MRKIIVKEGPLVFLRNVLVMELVAGLALYALSFLQNYETLYASWGLLGYMRYDIFLIITFSGFQLFYVSLLFLDWYFTHFEISQTEVIKKSGLLFRRRRFVDLSDVESVEIYQSPIDRWMKHATIILNHAKDKTTKIKNVASADDYAHVLKQIVHDSSGKAPTHKVSTMIDEGEGLFIEFKETLRYDVRKNEVSKDMEKAVAKAIVGFLNADGGTLVIGVNDEAEVVGLEKDYKTLPKKNRDGFENHLSQLVKTMIGMPFTKYVNIKFEKAKSRSELGSTTGMKDVEVCVVSVGASHKPAYLRNSNKKEDFFVRVGNSTQPFSMSETEEYIQTRWK